MQFQMFTIPAVRANDSAVEELNQFLRSHRVVNVDRQLINDGQNSYWTFCVSWLPAGSPGPKASRSSKPRVDYRQVLNEHDFAVFARLRTLRKELAEAEGVPAYALFTNEQLAEMVRRKAATPTALAEIQGVGEGRVAKYGEAFLSEIKGALVPTETKSDAEA